MASQRRIKALDDATIAGIESFFGDPPEETRTIILHAEGMHFLLEAHTAVILTLDMLVPQGSSRLRHEGVATSLQNAKDWF